MVPQALTEDECGAGTGGRALRKVQLAGAGNAAISACMFNQLLRHLSAPVPVAAPESRLALAALLVRLARADGDYAPTERDRIDRALSERFGLSPSAATALRSEGEALEAGAADTVRFTKVLKDAVPLDDRAELMQTLWSVVLADGVRAAEEDQAMRIVASLLGLTDRESGQARQRAEARR